MSGPVGWRSNRSSDIVLDTPLAASARARCRKAIGSAMPAARTSRTCRAGRSGSPRTTARRRLSRPSGSAPFPRHPQLHTGLLLQAPNNAEQVARLRVAARPEHVDQALGLRARRLAQFLEADRRLDVVAQRSTALPASTSPASMASMPSRSSASPKAGSSATRFCTSSLKLRVNATASLRSSRPRTPSSVVRPQRLGRLYIAPLAPLRAAVQEDHQHRAVLAELHPVSRPPSRSGT